MKSKDRLRRYRNRALSGFVVLLVAGLSAFGFGAYQSWRAVKASDDAEKSIAQSKERVRSAEEKANQDVQRAQTEAQTAIQNAQVEAQKKISVANDKRIVAEQRTLAAQQLEARARRDALEQQKIATSRRFAGQADRNLDEKPDLSLLFSAAAYDAHTKHPTLEASRSLLTALRTYKNLDFILRRHLGHVSGMAVTPDGTTLITGGADNKLIFWDLNSRSPRFVQATSVANTGSGLALTPNGEKVVTTGHDGKIVVWDVKTGTRRGILGSDEETRDGYSLVAAHRDNETIAATVGSNELVFVNIKDTEHPTELQRFAYGKDQANVEQDVSSLTFSDDGNTLVTGGVHGSLRLFDVTDIKRPKATRELREHDGQILSVVYSPDGKYFASADISGKVVVWNAKTFAHTSPYAKPEVITYGLAFSSNGRLLVLGKNDGEILTYVVQDLWDSSYRPNSRNVYGKSVSAAAFSSNSHHVISGNGDGTVTVWRLEGTGPLARVITGHEARVSSTAFSSDGNLMVSGDEQGSITMTDLAVADAKATPLNHEHTANVTSLSFHPKDKLMASSDADGKILLWRLRPKQGWMPEALPMAQAKINKRADAGPLPIAVGNSVRLVHFADGGRALVSVGPGPQVVIWDVASRSVRRIVPLPEEGANGERLVLWAVAANRDGGKLAVGYNNNALYLLDTADSKSSLKLLPGHEREVTSAAFSQDSRWLVSLDESGTGILWQISGRPALCKRFRPLLDEPEMTETAGIKAVAFSNDDKTLALGSSGSITLWDVESQTTMGSLDMEWIGYNLSFAPDGRTIASGSERGVVLLDINPASWADVARRIANRDFYALEKQSFQGANEESSNCASQAGKSTLLPQKHLRALVGSLK